MQTQMLYHQHQSSSFRPGVNRSFYIFQFPEATGQLIMNYDIQGTVYLTRLPFQSTTTSVHVIPGITCMKRAKKMDDNDVKQDHFDTS